jgi:hypothetical protein
MSIELCYVNYSLLYENVVLVTFDSDVGVWCLDKKDGRRILLDEGAFSVSGFNTWLAQHGIKYRARFPGLKESDGNVIKYPKRGK